VGILCGITLAQSPDSNAIDAAKIEQITGLKGALSIGGERVQGFAAAQRCGGHR
jgi:hypothetical protein